ncbi:hypothetical protein [Georgenia wangjunii]|uniref:hypothetical protein n=1 Tax=Georgenia wangjunii TaxID=3117730 RepID=UPI002F268908
MDTTRSRFSLGAAVAVGLGTGAAFAASAGPVGYAFGAVIGAVLFAASNAKR